MTLFFMQVKKEQCLRCYAVFFFTPLNTRGSYILSKQEIAKEIWCWNSKHTNELFLK